MCLQQYKNVLALSEHIGLPQQFSKFLEYCALRAGEESQQFWHKNETMALELSCSTKTIYRYLRYAESLGFMH